MKKILCFLMLLCLVGAMIGCSKKQEEPAASSEEASSAESSEEKAEEPKEESKEEGKAEEPEEESKEEESSEEEATEEDGQNPVMNFIGLYGCGRGSMLVEADNADNAIISVTWGSSAWENSEWTMSGKFDTETLTVNYDNCVRKDYEYEEDGTVKKETVAYENGTGSITFHEDNGLTLTWNDDQDHIADESVFTFGAPEEEPEEVYGEALVGQWINDRGTVEITKIEPAQPNAEFHVVVEWSDGTAKKMYSWEFDCLGDEVTGGMYSFETGIKTEITWDDNDEKHEEVVADNCATALELNENGELLWHNFSGDPDEETFWRAEEGEPEEEGEDVPGDVAQKEAFLGIWECDRASIEITEQGEDFRVLVHWGSSANEATVWEYDCYYDGVAGLASFETGSKTNIVWDENGEEQDEVVFEDGATSLTINENGTLTWNEYKENAGDGMEFVYVGPVEASEEEGSEFLGTWQCDRAVIRINRIDKTEQDETFHVLVTWGSSAFESASWEYLCYYDGSSLVSFEKGVMSHMTWDEDGQMTKEIVYTDGATSLSIEVGTLFWNEFKENVAEGMNFEYVGPVDYLPTPEALVNSYFLEIANVPQGTAGASLAQAQTACAAVRFANDCQIAYLEDADQFRANLLAAWESLTEEEQAAFDGNFMGIVSLIDTVLEDEEQIETVFADAGVAEEMTTLVQNEAAVSCWRSLCASTLTMGNNDGE